MADYGDPRKVLYYTWNPYFEERTSEREYIPVGNVRGSVIDVYEPHSHRETTMVDVTLYLDALSGVVVWDVEAYERTLAEKDGRA